MKDHFQTEDTSNNKEVEGSATENLKCLYLSTSTDKWVFNAYH